jgi:hypothetical protein
MLKIILLLLTGLLQSTLAYTWIVEDQCTDLKIQIINHSQSSCFLSKFILISGVIVNISEFRKLTVVAPWEVSPWFVVSENYARSTDFYGDPIHVFMEYDCGDGKMVTFVSQKSKCLRSSASVTGMVFSEYNMAISSELSDASMRENTPGTILWTFYDRMSA